MLQPLTGIPGNKKPAVGRMKDVDMENDKTDIEGMNAVATTDINHADAFERMSADEKAADHAEFMREWNASCKAGREYESAVLRWILMSRPMGWIAALGVAINSRRINYVMPLEWRRSGR